jgi:LAS superfamily LD-carboxypeptidase LdcB
MTWRPRGLVIHRWCPAADPLKLVPVSQSRDGKWTHLARPETVEAYRSMAEAARLEKVVLHVIWAFRSPQLQEEQFNEAERKYGKGKGIRWLAPPGFSEHQTGWVIDLGDWNDAEADDNPLFERTAAFHWLQKNAQKFYFELSFPRENWQGVGYEPWHWRYVGTAEAQRTFHPMGAWAAVVWSRSWKEAIRRWRRVGWSAR